MKKLCSIWIALTVALSIVGCETSQISDLENGMSTTKNESTDDIELTTNVDMADENKISYFVNLDRTEFQNHLVVANLRTKSELGVPNVVFNDNAEPVFKSSYSITQTGDYFDILDWDEGNRGLYVSQYFLADGQGNVLWGVDFSDGNDESFVYIDSGDGYLATLHENSGFSDVDYRASIYGPNGKLIKEFSFPDRIEGSYYGSGVFRFTMDSNNYDYENKEHFDFLYNVETDSIFYGEPNTDFVCGKSLKLDEINNLLGFYNTDGTYSKLDSPVNLISIRGGSKNTIITEPGHNAALTVLCDGIGVAKNTQTEKYFLFNLENQKVYPLDCLSNELYASDIYVKNGYAVFSIRGADGGAYTAIYDSEGNCVLKPEDSLKDYELQSLADDKCFFTQDTSDTDRDLQVYDLKKHEFIDASVYGKMIPVSDFSGNIAIAKTYINANENWFLTFIDSSYSSVLAYDTVNHYTRSGDSKQKTLSEYLPCMEMDLEHIKDAGPLDTNLIWSPDEDAVIVSEVVESNKPNLNGSEENEIYDNYEFTFSCEMKGQINCHGGTVAGFTTDYVVNGGAVGKVRNSLGDTWHVTAKNACDNYGVTWYELWDSDDGDYYGWVDSNYIDFY